MVQVNLSDYKNIYLQTAKEYLEKISLSLNKLSNNSLDKEAINDLHISSHSLKSQSQVMGYNDIAELSKSLEEISNNALLTNNPLTGDVIGEIRRSFKEMEEILKRAEDAPRDIQDDTGK